VKEEKGSTAPGILPVPRSKEEAKRFYNRISRVYDYLTGAFERKYAEMAVERLTIKEGETVLEIGFGPGHCLKRIAESVGQSGKAYGVDISSGMLEVARRRLDKAQLMDRVELHCGDAASLPYADNTFDAVFMSFSIPLRSQDCSKRRRESSSPGVGSGLSACPKRTGNLCY
jgi:demethylmenaquinone methyltransferase/2-methoxy-6-polyprenyl-1,4-benzoquinol methylase